MGLSFLRGLVASVNPCAFVLLPTYLMYFLGLAGTQPGDQRATVRRALLVSASVSAGFLAVFVAVGLVSEYVTGWIETNAVYATAAIGVAFVVLGIAMLAGYELPVSTPTVGSLGGLRAERATILAMAGYGVAYAVTSISCTLPLFSTTLFGNVRRDGWGSGLANVVAYGLGMALVVTALTVALAVANTSLLGALRASSRHVHRIAAVLVLASGLYLLYYFVVVDLNEGSSPVTDRVDSLQRRITIELQDRWQLVAVVLTAIVVAAVVFALGRRRDRSATVSSESEPDGHVL
ncbi:MAG: cytochrome c biogenesis CcdA family protein [Ilumatobacteraceae bacterium]